MTVSSFPNNERHLISTEPMNYIEKIKTNFLIYVFKKKLVSKIVATLEKLYTDKKIIALLSSSIYIRNSRGLNVGPWDMSNSIFEDLDHTLLNLVRLSRNLNHS